MNTEYIWTGHRMRRGYLVPSILNLPTSQTNTELIDVQESLLKDRDLFLEENNIPENYYVSEFFSGPGSYCVQAPAVRLSKLLYRRSGDGKRVISIYHKDKTSDVVNERLYVVGQLRSTKDSYNTFFYDFVEAGFFDEGDYQSDPRNFKLSEENTGDSIYDGLKKWVVSLMSGGNVKFDHRPTFIPGFAMYNADEFAVYSFIHKNENGQACLFVHTSSMNFYSKKNYEYDSWMADDLIKSYESLWAFKYLVQDYEVDEHNDKSWEILKETAYTFDSRTEEFNSFIIFSPRSKGYISYYYGRIRLNLYKSIVNADYAETYDPNEKISVARQILVDYYNWMKDKTVEALGPDHEDDDVSCYSKFKEGLKRIDSILSVLEGHTSILAEQPTVGYYETLGDFITNNGNQWVFQELTRDFNSVLIPEELMTGCHAYDEKGNELPLIPYSRLSLYEQCRKELVNVTMANVDYIVLTDANVYTNENFLRTLNGWLRDSLCIFPVYLASVPNVDLRLIGNLPNVSLTDLVRGDFVYRDELIFGDRKIARDIWYNSKEERNTVPYRFYPREDEEDDDEDEDDYFWSVSSLESVKEYLSTLSEEERSAFWKIVPEPSEIYDFVKEE